MIKLTGKELLYNGQNKIKNCDQNKNLIENYMVVNGTKEKSTEDAMPVPKIQLYTGKIHVEWDKVYNIGAGLNNIGNTCFMNTVLQCLTYCPPLANYLLHDNDHASKCAITGFCMMCLLQKHVKRAIGSTGEVIRPQDIFNHLKSIAKHFQHGCQEDAHEFLQYVIENLVKACLPQTNGISKLDPASKETTIINKIFGGYYRSQVICLRCKKQSNTYDPVLDFNLDIKQNVSSLEKALEKLTQPELLQHENSYKCPECKINVETQKKLSVYQAPIAATFQLKRFYYKGSLGGKITKQITYPEKINLRPYMSDTQGDPVWYRLNAVLVHSGRTCNSGHYYCYVKNSDGYWYEMDDTNVRKVSSNMVLNQNAYVLFYIRNYNAERAPLKSVDSQEKQAKKKKVGRQQHEIQRLQEAFIYHYMLSQFENENVRNDFLNGVNLAIKLTSEQLSQLDQLYKSIGPTLPADQADTSHHFYKLAENFIFLVEGKNKEIVGTTYKVLKDLLLSIKECGYFSKPSQVVDEDGPSSEGMPEDKVTNASAQNQEILKDDHISNDDIEQPQSVEQRNEEMVDVPVPKSPEETSIVNETLKYQNGPPLLSAQGTFNFLQESQIDLNALHVDPAVVAVHQMVPPQPTSLNFTGNAYLASPPVEEKIPVNGSELCELLSPVLPLNQVLVLPAAIPPHTVAPVLSPVQLNSQQEFDPSHPIPTQTFTNQSSAVMQNMITPHGFVPVTMHHGPMAHMAPVAVVPGLSTPVTTGAAAVPIPAPVAPVSVTPAVNNEDDTELKSKTEEIMEPSDDESRASRMFSPANALDIKKERQSKKAAMNFIKTVCLKGRRLKHKRDEEKVKILTDLDLNPVVDLGEKVPHTKDEVQVFLYKEMLMKEKQMSRNTEINSKASTILEPSKTIDIETFLPKSVCMSKTLSEKIWTTKLSKPFEPPKKKKKMTYQGKLQNFKFQEKIFEDFDHLFDDPDESFSGDSSKTLADSQKFASSPASKDALAKSADAKPSEDASSKKSPTMKEKSKVTPQQTTHRLESSKEREEIDTQTRLADMIKQKGFELTNELCMKNSTAEL